MIDIWRIKSKVSCWCPVTLYINISLVHLIGQQNCCAVVRSAVMLIATFRLEYEDDYEYEFQVLSTRNSKIFALQT